MGSVLDFDNVSGGVASPLSWLISPTSSWNNGVELERAGFAGVSCQPPGGFGVLGRLGNEKSVSPANPGERAGISGSGSTPCPLLCLDWKGVDAQAPGGAGVFWLVKLRFIKCIASFRAGLL